MWRETVTILCAVCFVAVNGYAQLEDAGSPNSTASAAISPGDSIGRPVELARYKLEYSSAYLEPARMDSKFGIAVIFKGTDDLHFYAKPETAPAPGMDLNVQAESEDLSLGNAIFPKWDIFKDPVGKNVEVYVGDFTVFVPIDAARPETVPPPTHADIEVKITGIACTSMVCLQPFEKTLTTTVNWSERDAWKPLTLETTSDADVALEGPSYSAWFALGLAFIAGLALNIMPCVWPVLPLIVMRIVEQAKQTRGKSVTMGLAFCFGILLFFAALAGANIILRIFYGTVLQWGDQFRNPAFLAAMALLLVVLALFMFGLFTITLPSSIAGKSSSGKGYSGAVGMGFLAAILSTPCSFGILAAAFAWAQAQPLLLATFTIMVIGVGMALPYGVLTSMPGLLKGLPKAGRWMELFKQTVGFILLAIAVKLITALPETRIAGVLYFAVVLAFCVWMWGSWVSYGTRPARKWTIRIIAIALAVTAGWMFLPAPAAELIDWQQYDSDTVETALKQQQPVLIKFTADWCLNCKIAEKVAYSRKDIATLIRQKGVLAIKADTSEKDAPATLALKNIYNEPGVPVSMLFIPGKKEPTKWNGIFFADELQKSLESLPDKQ